LPSLLVVEIIMPSAVTHTRAGLRSAELGTVAVPRTYSWRSGIAVAAPRAWNNLPFSLHATVSVGCFAKKKLENVLITLPSCLNVFITLFLSFKLLGALVLPLGHLHHPTIRFITFHLQCESKKFP